MPMSWPPRCSQRIFLKASARRRFWSMPRIEDSERDINIISHILDYCRDIETPHAEFGRSKEKFFWREPIRTLLACAYFKSANWLSVFPLVHKSASLHRLAFSCPRPRHLRAPLWANGFWNRLGNSNDSNWRADRILWGVSFIKNMAAHLFLDVRLCYAVY